MNEFRVGDVVELIIDEPDYNQYLKAGSRGVVRALMDDPESDYDIGVEFDDLDGENVGHSLYGELDNDNGWWCKSDWVFLVDNGIDSDITEINDDEFAALLSIK